jgi:hypothetical protein
MEGKMVGGGFDIQRSQDACDLPGKMIFLFQGNIIRKRICHEQRIAFGAFLSHVWPYLHLAVDCFKLGSRSENRKPKVRAQKFSTAFDCL